MAGFDVVSRTQVASRDLAYAAEEDVAMPCHDVLVDADKSQDEVRVSSLDVDPSVSGLADLDGPVLGDVGAEVVVGLDANMADSGNQVEEVDIVPGHGEHVTIVDAKGKSDVQQVPVSPRPLPVVSLSQWLVREIPPPNIGCRRGYLSEETSG